MADALTRTDVRRAGMLVERNLMIYRHTWYLLLAEIIEPVLYLLSIGVGIGQLVGHVPGTGGVAYAAYVAPALLATAAMNGSMNETTFNLFSKLKLHKTYDSILATPMTVASVAFGEVAWALLRGVIITTSFLAVIAVFGLLQSPWVLLVFPAAGLIGFAFASTGLLVVTFLRGWQDMQFIQLVMLPMFLFATTFYPLGVYPRWLQLVVECLPLFQSIELVREPALGHVGWSLLLPAAYLLMMGVASLALARRRLTGVLLH